MALRRRWLPAAGDEESEGRRERAVTRPVCASFLPRTRARPPFGVEEDEEDMSTSRPGPQRWRVGSHGQWRSIISTSQLTVHRALPRPITHLSGKKHAYWLLISIPH